MLVEELCGLDCVRDPGQRVLFGQSVGEFLKKPVDLQGRDARSDTVAIVQAVLREQQDPEPGVTALLYAVSLHEGSDVAGTVRERILGAWRSESSRRLLPFEAFEDNDVKAARALLAGHAGTDEGRLCDLLSDELGLDLPRHLTTTELFEHLLDTNAQADGLPPAVILLELTAVLTPHESTRRRLREWCDSWSASAGAQAALLRRREQIEARDLPDREIPRCLIVMVDPAEDGSPDVYVRHWVNRTVGYWAPVPGRIERVTLDTLDAAVERAVRRGEEFWTDADRDGEDQSPIHVEFVLPYSLLNYDVAGLHTVADSSHPVPIGLRYYVHLRSLDRMRLRDPAQLRRWRLRWNSLKASAVARHHSWSGDVQTADDLGMWHRQLVADQRLTAVLLGTPALEGRAMEPLKAAIAEGIGVGLWDRRDPAPQEARTLLDMVIGYPAAQLPITVHRLRLKAATAESGHQLPGGHVAFLYDDPFRLVDYEEEEGVSA
ncbi:VMAP-C domain-containing protein [Streptomyces sp. 4N509B]|uniref:VMAP-C domain-containing protein n=1 Tax=Streptomyces sp. 4N509B TaxID=3457413 RepID=UPI003FD6140E